MLSKLDGLTEKVNKAYENYEFHLVFQTVVDFCANELSAQYFDIQKDTLYTGKKDGLKRRSAQTALYRIAKEMLVVLAPVTSFTAEEAYEFLPGTKSASVFLEPFPKPARGQRSRRGWASTTSCSRCARRCCRCSRTRDATS